MHKWFLLGVMLAIVTAFLPPYLFGGLRLSEWLQAHAILVVLGTLLLIMTPACVSTGFRDLGSQRRHRPHVLFTPLYEQR